MMDKFTEMIALYLEEALPDDDAAALEDHMAGCETCLAELETLTRLEQLLAGAPLVDPPVNFTATFEVRLNRRLNRRRTLIGVAVIGVLTTALLGVGLWTVAASGLSFLNLFSGVNVLTGAIRIIEITLPALTPFFKVAGLSIRAILQAVRHPVFWGYILLGVGIISFWAQLLRRMQPAAQPAVNRSPYRAV